MKNETELKKVLELLPACISLCDVNYNDNLNDRIDLLQSCVMENSQDKLYEFVDTAFTDSEEESIQQYMKELQDEVSGKFGLGKDEACQLVEKYEDNIRDVLCERNDSTPVDDLLENTRKFSLFIDTGLAIDDNSYRWTRSEETGWLKKIKRKLKINTSQWDKEICSMLQEASYGGQLVIYFYDRMDSLITDNEKDWESLSFTNPVIAIINTNEGAGGDARLEGHTFSMPFVRANLFIDKYFKYNYVSAVCGMDQDWCGDSKAVFSYGKLKGKKSTVSPLAGQALKDRKYAETYRNGGCTLGDMDINRHRDVYYENNYPCGSKCPHCGIFWID
jgi:hypothetical protein